jgi:hypothetical protein
VIHLFAGLLLAFAVLPSAASVQADGPEMYASLRDRALQTKIDDLGIRVSLAADAPMPFVYGVVMDVEVDGGTATLVAFITGDASLYLSNGGGRIGGIADPHVIEAARNLIEAARHADLAGTTATTAFPGPGPGQVHFFLLTSDGVHLLAAPVALLDSGGHALSPLFGTGDEVFTQFRLIDEREGRGAE